MKVENWPLMDKADDGGVDGTGGPNTGSGAGPGSEDLNGDNEEKGSSGPSTENRLAELERKNANQSAELEKANTTITDLQNKAVAPPIPTETQNILDGLKNVFSPEVGRNADPVAALGPAPDPYTDGFDEYQKWSDQRTSLLIQKGVTEGITTAQSVKDAQDGRAGFSKANTGADQSFRQTFRLRTGREVTKEEIDVLASFTNKNIAATGDVFSTPDGPRRAYSESDIWKGYKLMNHDEIVGKAASSAQSDAAKALRDVSDPSLAGPGVGPTDAMDFTSMSVNDQAVTLKQLDSEGRFGDARSLIQDLREKDPRRVDKIREVISNAEEVAKDQGFGGLRTFN